MPAFVVHRMTAERSVTDSTSGPSVIRTRASAAPARRRYTDPGYATVVAFTDEIGPVKPVYGMWQDVQATLRKTERFLSHSSSFPRTWTCCIPLSW